MLEISYEFRKGILFIRLNGELTGITSEKLKKEITDMIEDNGITNVVFNITSLSLVDEVGIQSLEENFKICKKNHGNALLCGINKEIKKILLKSIWFDKTIFIDNELNAFYKIMI